SGGVSRASSGSYSARRGRTRSLRSTDFRCRSRSVVPKTGVTSEPEYVVGIAATMHGTGGPDPPSCCKRNAAAFAVPIGLPPPRPTSTSARKERASRTTSSIVSEGTCGRDRAYVQTNKHPKARRTLATTRHDARLVLVTRLTHVA